MKIKVCGITTKKDALALDLLSIDYLGFIFYPKSKRYIAPLKAQEIISSLKNTKTVGVFVDQSAEEINNIIKITGINIVQLHGKETNEVIQKINVPTIKTISILNNQILNNIEPSSNFLLFDTQTKNSIGGTGFSFNWNILKDKKFKIPFFIAGGIGPKNIQQIWKKFPNIYSVDLNSKVEISPGIKDLKKIKICIKAIKD